MNHGTTETVPKEKEVRVSEVLDVNERKVVYDFYALGAWNGYD